VADYVPGTEEKDPKKVIMALQQTASSVADAQDAIDTNTSDIATNTANIATNTADIATNTADIATNTAAIAANAAAIAALIPSGTPMLFVQTSAPTGWTKVTSHNDKALRVVSGSASSGGTNSFSTVMAQTTVGNTTLSNSTVPAHSHTINVDNTSGTAGGLTTWVLGASLAAGGTQTSSSSGSGGAHNHTITMSIQYVDVIIATKD
jgi:hypothetical protein